MPRDTVPLSLQGVAYAEAHHGILVLGAFGQCLQELGHHAIGVAAIEVVAVR